MVLSISEERYGDHSRPRATSSPNHEENGWPDTKQQLAIEAQDSTGHSVTKSQQQMDSSSEDYA